MDLIDEIKKLKTQILQTKDMVKTESATIVSFIYPFLQILGYNVFNPLEVIPEYNADLKREKGEKVDIAILKDKKPIIIIECKHHDKNLGTHKSQIRTYFTPIRDAKFAILTNGIEYRFYTDLTAQNIMDDTPFLKFDITEEIPENILKEIKKFHKDNFNKDELISTASKLKDYKAIKDFLTKEIEDPSADFVKFIIKQIPSIKVKHNDFDKSIIKDVLGDILKDKFRITTQLVEEQLENPRRIKLESDEDTKNEEGNIKIQFTELEKEGLNIIKAILSDTIDINRISYNDTINYCSIILDDNKRNKICIFHFNNPKSLYIDVYNGNIEVKQKILNTNEIYKYKKEIREKAISYPPPENKKTEIDILNNEDESNNLAKADENIKKIYKLLKIEILKLDKNIQICPTKLYVAFKYHSNICDIEIQKRQLKIFINVKKETFNEPFLRDISNIGHYGNGDYEYLLKEEKDITQIMPFIKKSLEFQLN